MVFERKLYLEQLIRADGNGMIKVITGIRRCGKSFLVFNLFRQYLLEQGVSEDHIIQVNMEDRRNKKYRDPDRLLEHIDAEMVDAEKYYILLDEVQMVKEFEDVLNSYLSVPNAEILCDWIKREVSVKRCHNRVSWTWLGNKDSSFELCRIL